MHNFRKKSHEAQEVKSNKSLIINENLFLCFLAGLLLFACSREKEVEEKVPQEKPKDKETTQLIEKQKVSGFVQKGPFVSGSTLTANELEEDLSQTGKTFTAVLKNDEGAFDLKNIKLKSPYVQLSVDGFFFNEITGKLSTSKITLYAVSNVKDRSSVNVNLLTHLQKPRVEKLMEKGKTFAEAKAQSLLEIGKSFYLTDKDLKGINPEDIQLTGKDAASLMLLAASSIVLEGKKEAALTQFLTQYSDDLADNGVIDKKEIQASIRESSYRLHLWDDKHKRPIDYIAENVVAYYKKMGKTVTIGDFGKYIDHNKDGDLSDYKSLKPTLNFQGMVRGLSGGKKISTQEILKQLGGQGKAGYTIKTIALSGLNSSFAKVTGAKPNLGLELLKTGEFKATITLEHPQFNEVSKILAIKVVAQKFIFNKLTRQSDGGNVISTEQILAQIPNAKNRGYQLKSIKLSDDSLGEVKNLQINLKKTGNFTATIILSHPKYFDVTVANCAFESILPTFSFDKLTRGSDGSKVIIINTAQILAQISNAKIRSYQLKSIKLSDDSLAQVSGTAPNFKIYLKKHGNFTATIILSHPTYFDVKIENCSFSYESIFSVSANKITGLKQGYKNVEIVNIPSTINGVTITTIGDSAFSGYKYLTSVTIPDSVTTIGSIAFHDCYSLTAVNIPNSVTTISPEGFKSCPKLVVTIEQTDPSKIKLGWGALYVKYILVPDASVSAYRGAWSNYSRIITGINNYKLHNVFIFDKATGTIMNVKDKGIKTAIIPDKIAGVSVTTIGDSAFSGCSSLTSVTIPNSVTTIGDSAFSGCSSLTSVTIPNSVTTIGSEAFYHCWALTSVTIPNSVTTIGERAFSRCDALTSITIPNSVTTIGASAFYDCRSLTIRVPNSLKNIGSGAFDLVKKVIRY